jgi:hypothetical protein
MLGSQLGHSIVADGWDVVSIEQRDVPIYGLGREPRRTCERIDAGKIADCLRCDFLPECYLTPSEIRERRRNLRYRNLLVRQTVQCKNKIAQMLMEAGVSYNKEKLHQGGYFHQLLATKQGSMNRFGRCCGSAGTIYHPIAQDGSCAVAVSPTRSTAERTREAADEHSGGWTDYGVNVGAGAWRCETFPLDQTSHQLLRTMRGGSQLQPVLPSERPFPNNATGICKPYLWRQPIWHHA